MGSQILSPATPLGIAELEQLLLHLAAPQVLSKVSSREAASPAMGLMFAPVIVITLTASLMEGFASRSPAT